MRSETEAPTRISSVPVATLRMGLISSVAVLSLSVAYAVPLLIGLATLTSPDVPIADPWRSLMELLIMLLTVPIVTLAVATYLWASPEQRPAAMASALFLLLSAGLTFGNHFFVLILSHQAAFTGQSWSPLLVSFSWPSVPNVLDFLAWDVFFAVGVLFGGLAFRGSRLQKVIRILFLASGTIALFGLTGVLLNDMQVRDVGIVGYALVYPIAVCFIAVMFARALKARVAEPSEGRK